MTADVQAEPGTILVPLTQGKVAVIDAADEWVMEWKWCLSGTGINSYAMRKSSGRRTIYMHREIMRITIGCDLNGIQVDHQDGDRLNDRRSNLRIATHADNMRNRGKQENNTSGHPGVSWHKRDKVWQSQISVNDKTIHLGLFTDLQDAIVARRAAEIQHFETFAPSLSRGLEVKQ